MGGLCIESPACTSVLVCENKQNRDSQVKTWHHSAASDPKLHRVPSTKLWVVAKLDCHAHRQAKQKLRNILVRIMYDDGNIIICALNRVHINPVWGPMEAI